MRICPSCATITDNDRCPSCGAATATAETLDRLGNAIARELQRVADLAVTLRHASRHDATNTDRTRE